MFRKQIDLHNRQFQSPKTVIRLFSDQNRSTWISGAIFQNNGIKKNLTFIFWEFQLYMTSINLILIFELLIILYGSQQWIHGDVDTLVT